MRFTKVASGATPSAKDAIRPCFARSIQGMGAAAVLLRGASRKAIGESARRQGFPSFEAAP